MMKNRFLKLGVSAMLSLTLLTQGVAGAAAAGVQTNGVQLGDNGLSQTVEGGAILHCWCWNFNTIKEKIPEIAAAGFSAVQTSPICEVNNGGDGSLTISGGDNWWWHYQPTDYKIGNYQFGTQEEFKEMCDVAHQYGVKVIVDSVLNHTTAYYNQISDNIKNLEGNPFHPMGSERTPDQQWSEVDRYEETQYDLSGLYDLNTQNKAVQNYILDFLKTCVENGADGFRFDAAKLIELPDDTSEKYGNDFASDFWPTVLQNGAYFQYGEVLQEGGRHLYRNSETGYDDNDSSRLGAYHSQTFTDKDGGEHNMNTTNSFTGFRIRDAITGKNLTADFVMDALLPDGAKANQTVTWVESHDNYCNDQSYLELTETQQVIQAWAAIAARKDGTPLFFDRPNNSNASNPWGDNKIGPEGSDMYKDPQVAAVNFFRNEMGQSAQKATNPIEGNTQVLMIERGDDNKGVVIINVSDEDVVISADTTMDDGQAMQDGAYTDQAFGGAFEVTDGVLSGTVKAGKVAVVYSSAIDPDSKEEFEPAVNLSVPSGYFLTDVLSVDVTVRSCARAEYTLTAGAETVTNSVSAGDAIVIDALGHNEKATVTLNGYDAQDNVIATVTREYTRWVKQNNTIAYLEADARPDWTTSYAYVWGTAENAGWPGVQMEKTANGLYKYVLPYQYEMAGSNGNVIFNNGKGEQFDAGSITAGQQMVYTLDGKWKAYSAADYEEPAVSLTPGSGYYVIGETELKAIVRNCSSAEATVVINGDTENAQTYSVKNGDSIPLDSLQSGDTATVTLIGCDSEGVEAARATATLKGWVPQGNTAVYLDKAAQPAWTNAYTYVWGSAQNNPWPGIKMDDKGDYYAYTLPYQYELDGSYGNVIFNNGSGQQFDAGQIKPAQRLLYTGGKFVALTLGDVNNDGVVDISDATEIQMCAASLTELSLAQRIAADVNGDGEIDVTDATYLQMFAADLIKAF